MTAEEKIEKAVGELYAGYFRLRQQKRYKEEYDSMGALLNMLMKDREELRKRHPELDGVTIPTEEEKRTQGARCPCDGADEYCTCQNVVQK